MDNELNEFLAEGMKRYKEASRIMVLFGRSIEGELADILSKRKKWGIFKPVNTKKPRSTKYWHEYPCLNAEIIGTIYEKEYWIRIDINWFMSEGEYPFYSILFQYGELDERIQENFDAYNPGNFEISENNKGITMTPDPEDYDLHRDFNALIDEFVKNILK